MVLVTCLASAATYDTNQVCNPDIKILNQDPYPALPGDYVKLVFQVNGLENKGCGDVLFSLEENFPISFDPGVNNTYFVKSGTYVNDYTSSVLIKFKIKIDNSAIDGYNEIKRDYIYNYGKNSNIALTKDLNLSVKDTLTDFEVSIKDYDATNQIMTFEIINVGKNDVNALTIDLPKQEQFAVKGTTRNIIGNFDTNEDTSFTFEGIPSEGNINLYIEYNDQINERRNLTKLVYFDSNLFSERKKDEKKTSYTSFIVLAIIVAIIIFWVVGRIRRKRKLEKMRKLAKK